MLHLHLLGPPSIEIDGQPVVPDTRKATALLTYLAVTGQSHSRDALAALLYPDYDQSRARAALRRTLSSLKTSIGEPWLAIERDTVALSHGDEFWCDAWQFQRLLAQGQAGGEEGNDPACLPLLQQAVALYRGDFLAGFTLRDSAAFDDWQRFETERLRRDLLGALERLVRLLTTAGRLGEAVMQAQRLLAIDPLHEPAHRVLMLLYVWTGQQPAALHQYRECVRVLSEDLGVAPLAETTRVYEAIKEQRIPPPPAALRTAHRHSAAAPRPAPLPLAPTPGAAGTLPMVGRDAELAALQQARLAAGSAGHFAALEGEPGIGKTRLAEEFCASVQASGDAVVAGRCFQGETGLAYGVWLAALRAALAEQGAADRLASAPDSALAEAARLLPELAAGRALPAARPLDHPGAQAQFFEGLCHVVQALAGRAGVLFLDDLQWADGASLDALAYLVHRLAGRPLLVLAAWRGEDSPAVQRLRSLARDAQRAEAGLTLHLSRLSRSDVLALAAHLPAGGGQAERLYQESEGLPLFVVEYLKALQAGQAQAGEWTQPQGVHSLLLARLAAVDEAGQQLLAAAAVIGRSFDYETLRAASGRSEEETVDCLEQLVRQGLVREGVASAAGSYDFSHEQLRTLVYKETGLARRRLLHRRVAEALMRQQPHSARAADAAAGQIAHHWQMGGRDQEAAVHYAQAGKHAASLYAHGEALAHFQMALALGHPDDAMLHEAIGDLHTLAGRYGPARSAYEQAAALAQDSEKLPRIEHKLALLHHRQGNWEQAESHFQAAQEAWPASTLPGLAQLLADRSLNAHHRGKQRQAETLAQEALQLAGPAQDGASLARAHNALGVLARHRGDLASAVEHLSQGLALAETLDDPTGRVAALNNLALVRQAQGDPAAAIRLTESALALCATHGDRHREAALHNNLADFLHAAGQPDAAMGHLKQAVTIFAEISDPDGAPRQPGIWKLVEW